VLDFLRTLHSRGAPIADEIETRFLVERVPRAWDVEERRASSRSALRAPGYPSAGLRPARCANGGGGMVRMRERSRHWEWRLSRERAARRRCEARYDVGTSSTARWFWGRSRGNVGATG